MTTTITVGTDQSSEFVESLKIACVAGNGKDHRPALECVRIISDGTKVVIVATDSFVLWEETFLMDCPVFDIMVPSKELKKTLASAAKRPMFILEIGEDRVIVNDETMIRRVLHVDYPNYETLFPNYDTADDAPRSHVSLGAPALNILQAITKTIDGRPVRLYAHPDDYGKPIMVKVRDGVRCIVMPVRHERDN